MPTPCLLDERPAGAQDGFAPDLAALVGAEAVLQIPLQDTTAFPPRRDAALAGVTLLVVEDSRFASDALRLMTQRAGGRLRRADCLATAHLHLAVFRPDVVLVDLGLPDGPGEALIAELAAQALAPVILGMSAEADGRTRALAAGASGYLDKPIGGMQDFLQAILAPSGPLPAPPRPEPSLQPDLLALHDDLLQAEQLLAIGPDLVGPVYLTRFVAGFARAAGDQALVMAAEAALTDPDGLPALHRLVLARLADAGDLPAAFVAAP